MKSLQLIINKSEITAGTRGASIGVDGMIVAASKLGSRYFMDYPALEVPNFNHLLLEEVKFPTAKRIGGLVRVYKKVQEEIKKQLSNGNFPLVLGADHGSAGGTIAGVKTAFPDKRLGVIWVDAHADIHSPYTTPSGNLHGMPLATAINEDNLESKVNDVDPSAELLWEELKNLGGIAPKIKPEDLVYIGVRDTEAPEETLMEKLSIQNIPVKQVRIKGAREIAHQTLESLKDCDIIYLSFDVDSLDPTVSVGTGTPVPDGLMVYEAENLLLELCKSPKICCFEMVEINPTLDDKGNVMAETAFNILEEVTDQIKKTHDIK